MSYRPITDVWILARPKVKYYGAYPNGFLERARMLLGVHRTDPVLHVCGGRAKSYPAWLKLCPNDYTLDLNGTLATDFAQDARDPLPKCPTPMERPWPALIADPPYTEADTVKYDVSAADMPQPNALLRNMLDAVEDGGRVGMLHYVWPQPPVYAKSIACIGVIVGFNNRMRVFSVFEKAS